VPISVSVRQCFSISSTTSAVAACLRSGAVPIVRRMPLSVALTSSELVGGSVKPASLYAYRTALILRPMELALMPACAWEARNAAMVARLAVV
jgi:hypothetical protein